MSHWPHRPALVQPGKDHTVLGVTRGSLGRATLPWESPEGSLGRTTLPWGPPGVLVGLCSTAVNRQQGTEVAGADMCGSSSWACTSCLITPAWWSLGSPSGPPWSWPPLFSYPLGGTGSSPGLGLMENLGSFLSSASTTTHPLSIKRAHVSPGEGGPGSLGWHLGGGVARVEPGSCGSS